MEKTSAAGVERGMAQPGHAVPRAGDENGTSMRARPALRLLRALALGLSLFFYTTLGLWRTQPPVVAYAQEAILLALFAWWAWKAVRGRGLPGSPVALPLAAFVGAVVLAALFSVDRRLSFPGVFEVLTPALFFFVFCELLLAGWSAGTFVDSILLLAAILMAQGLGATGNWFSIWWQRRVPAYPTFPVSFRLFGVADHPNLLAALINLALPFAIVRLARARRPAARLLYGLWLVAADVVLFCTRSRAAWGTAAVVAALTVGWLLLERRPQRLLNLAAWLRRTWRVWLAAAAYLALFVALFTLDARSSQTGFTTSGGSVSSLASRPLFWKVAWRNFLAHPLTGSGPATYAYVYATSVARIREWVSPHAHNLFLHVLTEDGAIGLAALLWLLAAAALALARGWRSLLKTGSWLGTERSDSLLCVCAALSGCCLVHAQADIPTWLPANALLVVMLVAVGLQAASALTPGRTGLSRWRLLGLAVPLLLGVVLARQNTAYAALLRGVDAAGGGDWRAAATALDETVALDPGFSFYQAQRGYAYGVLADPLTVDGDPAALDSALASYQAALQAREAYVPGLVNAAWLEEQAGSPQEAEELLAQAVSTGPEWALPALLLGDRYAAQGRAAEAEAMFASAFGAEWQARDMAACRRSAACREAASRIPAKMSPAEQASDRAQALLGQGQPGEALTALQGVPLGSADPLPWLDRADAHAMLGQLAEARYALTVASVLEAADPAHSVHNALSNAAYARSLGRTTAAIAALEQVARPQAEWVSYDVAVFAHVPLPGLWVPSLARLARTPEDLAVYRELAALYAEEGRAADAAWATREAEALAALLGEATDGG